MPDALATATGGTRRRAWHPDRREPWRRPRRSGRAGRSQKTTRFGRRSTRRGTPTSRSPRSCCGCSPACSTSARCSRRSRQIAQSGAAARSPDDDVSRRPAGSYRAARRVERRRADGGARHRARSGDVQRRARSRSSTTSRAHKPEVIYDPPDHRQRVVAAGYRSVLAVCLAARDQQFGLQFWSKQVNGVPPRAGADRAAHRGARRAGGLASAARRGGEPRGRSAGACRAARGARPLAVRGARLAHRLRPRDWPLARVDSGAEGGDAGGVDGNHGAADRRIGHRQGSRSRASSIARRRAARARSSP